MQKVFWTLRARGLLHWCEIGLHRCKRGVWLVQKTLGRHLLPKSQKDLLHPPLTTFGNFHFSGNFPGPQHPNSCFSFPIFLAFWYMFQIPFSGRRIGNIAVGRGFVNSFSLRTQVTVPKQLNSKIQFESLARKGSREAFFSLCSQYVFR